jgi:PKD repeat protein
VSEADLEAEGFEPFEAPPPTPPPPPDPIGVDFEFDVDDAAMSATFTSSVTKGDVLYYHWDFGDLMGVTTQDAEHEYRIPGSYLVTLTGSNDETETKTEKRVEIPYIEPPEAPDVVA